jgi:hypothetical protein
MRSADEHRPVMLIAVLLFTVALATMAVGWAFHLLS